MICSLIFWVAYRYKRTPNQFSCTVNILEAVRIGDDAFLSLSFVLDNVMKSRRKMIYFYLKILSKKSSDQSWEWHTNIKSHFTCFSTFVQWSKIVFISLTSTVGKSFTFICCWIMIKSLLCCSTRAYVTM